MTLSDDRPAAPRRVAQAADAIDLAHLARQTMGDKALAAEVLSLFTRQALISREELAKGGDEERRRLAHRLKGAARGVGAFAVADCAEALEAEPSNDALGKALAARIGEACAFIIGMSGQKSAV